MIHEMLDLITINNKIRRQFYKLRKKVYGFVMAKCNQKDYRPKKEPHKKIATKLLWMVKMGSLCGVSIACSWMETINAN